jgi:hypothetical protein
VSPNSPSESHKLSTSWIFHMRLCRDRARAPLCSAWIYMYDIYVHKLFPPSYHIRTRWQLVVCIVGCNPLHTSVERRISAALVCNILVGSKCNAKYYMPAVYGNLRNESYKFMVQLRCAISSGKMQKKVKWELGVFLRADFRDMKNIHGSNDSSKKNTARYHSGSVMQESCWLWDLKVFCFERLHYSLNIAEVDHN